MKTFYKTLIVLILVLLKTQFIYSQWVPTNGPYGGSVTCLAVSGTNIVAGYLGGVCLSKDYGTNWTQVGLLNYSVLSIAFNGTTIVAGTGGKPLRLDFVNGTLGVMTGGVHLSTNYGADWPGFFNQTPIDKFSSVAISGNNIIAGKVGYGVYLSTNNGIDWTKVGPFNSAPAFAVSGAN